MRWDKAIAVFAVVLAVAAGAWASLVFLGDFITLGLDLKGGVQVRLEAEGSVTSDQIDQVIEIMETRINQLGVTEPTIQKEGSSRVLIELPGIQDPEEAIEIIGKTAKLEFQTSDGSVVLDGANLKNATEAKNPSDNSYVVQLEFDAEGQRRFSEVTTRLTTEFANVGQSAVAQGDYSRNIAIVLDDEIISNPYVNEAITTGNAVITGSQSLEEARTLALLLRSGALPVPVEIVEKRTIGPTLGADSIEKSKFAGLVGLGAIIIFMIVYYRLPGVVASVSLILYTVLLLWLMVLIRATLTLPGIAGLVLSIGMCIDANILVYERLKEELRNGKSLHASVAAGFSRALTAIIDSNITTLIAAGVLFWLGTGTIRGFAVTLSLGIVVSMFTAVIFTQFVLKNLVDSKLITNPGFYGA
ncbi:MAG: protein translocase subunit SecD [Peptococcaceae bacterium]|jgi:preprotein translocase subunit SecD|nr:protein translocase subunit SecD [Peptococcaceae bacterium]